MLVWNHNFRQVMKFVYLRTTCSLTVLNMGYKLDLLQLKKVVCWRFTYCLSLTNKARNHVSLQAMKFVNCYSPYFLFVLNIGLKLTSTKYWNSRICTRTTAQMWSTWLVLSDEMCIGARNLVPYISIHLLGQFGMTKSAVRRTLWIWQSATWASC
jgi:hypothetical protein